MLAIPIKKVIETARNLELVYWNICEGSDEIDNQDENISVEESMQLLEESFNDLQEYAKAGDRVKISMQSHSMAGGAKKGMKRRKFYVYLKAPEAKATISGIGNIDLMRENVELKMKAEHDKEKSELLKRIEALEAPEPESSNLDKSIEGITHILNHPITSLVVSYFAGKAAAPAAAAPAINGLPDYEELLNRIEKIDPNFIEMLKAITEAAESNSNQYFMYRNMLVK